MGIVMQLVSTDIFVMLLLRNMVLEVVDAAQKSAAVALMSSNR